MTCIAAIIDKDGKGHIACDSIGSNGHTKTTYKNRKIFSKGNILLGYTSSYRMGQLLEHSLVIPPRKVGQTLDNYIYVDFVSAVRQLFKDNGYGQDESYGVFIIVTEGRIFKLQADLSVLESVDNFDSCGSGEDYALATIHLLVEQGDSNYRAILAKAIETADKYIVGVGGEVHYLKEEKI